ncbi:rho guanine nucleotide exchange factor 8-like [Zingiber officinale]|uniref:PRONE domain-containing protein n=1 Tax=Zingiber officinale TaxID=94328 RepID=A0A8J5F4N5_ZINOF|nr:rho guanine nucleotide exchange factor 8-like [Zingiber officinale]KAG6479895.1 hypothetical protein ZIOFF_063371 [Zingiber officinale]
MTSTSSLAGGSSSQRCALRRSNALRSKYGAVNPVIVRFLKPAHGGDAAGKREEACDASARKPPSLVMQSACGINAAMEGKAIFHSKGRKVGCRLERQQNEAMPTLRGKGARLNRCPSEMEIVKEKFSKLLLGEDMSGGGKGVSSALALSNAITNLAASVFSEQRRLEPMPTERKVRWRKQIDWILSVADHIVDFIPSQQKTDHGSNMEVMVTVQRRDLQMAIPALRKLDALLLDYLDNFKDHNEFWYVSKDANESEKENSNKNDGKWWLPIVKVHPNGLSEVSQKWLQFQKDSVNQVLKAAMAINSQVLMEMEIPGVYLESLPKNGKACLGDAIYRSITDEVFDLEQFLKSMDLSTEYKILDLVNRIEASIVIWKRKLQNKENKTSWASPISLQKREQFEERAETILLLIKQRFRGLPQSVLDTSKIQYCKDVGQSILESYSRVLESLAFTVMSQIEDVLDAASETEKKNEGICKGISNANDTKKRTLPDAAKAKNLAYFDRLESL